MPTAIVLLSGGLDSSTALAIAKKRGFEIVALTFSYGQKHEKEIQCAKKVARKMGVAKHIVFPISHSEPLNSSLTSDSDEIPLRRGRSDMAGEIPSTYVPGRNIVFLSIASSIAESMGASSVFIAVNAVDFSGYPDCTPEFIESYQRVLDVGTKAGREGRGIRVEAPLLRMSKADIVREAIQLKVPLELTWSCYRGGRKACGRCDSCVLRLEGFRAAGAKDPLDYEVVS